METKNIVAASIVGVAAVSFIGWQIVNDKDDKIKTKQDNSIPVANQDNNQKQNPAGYKDGNYSSDGSYMAPPGKETLLVNLDIKNNIISSVSVSPKNISDDSRFFFDAFQKGFNQEVVGKNIDEVKLSVINGSSLTPNGFMDALSKIKEQAKN